MVELFSIDSKNALLLSFRSRRPLFRVVTAPTSIDATAGVTHEVLKKKTDHGYYVNIIWYNSLNERAMREAG
jgi:hypothetical protein